jgi:DNA-binding winged helix-turn-helix (wHTH) protein
MSDRGEIFEFGQFRVDVLRRSLEREGQAVALSGKAFEILRVLLEQRGEVVDKDALLRQVWPDTAVEENNITVAISSLRKALGETPASPKRIVTIAGRGYSFVGEVRCNPPTAETSPQIAATTAPLPRSRTVYLFIAGALLASLSAYGLIAWLTPNWFSPKALRSVAILPFSVLNPDSKNDYLGLGLTDAVITRLANCSLSSVLWQLLIDSPTTILSKAVAILASMRSSKEASRPPTTAFEFLFAFYACVTPSLCGHKPSRLPPTMHLRSKTLSQNVSFRIFPAPLLANSNVL